MSTKSIVQLEPNDYRILVGWMETPDNYAAVHGTGGTTKVGGKRMISKIAAFGKMAEHLHRFSTTEGPPLTHRKEHAVALGHVQDEVQICSKGCHL
jgi:hypothetical protein